MGMFGIIDRLADAGRAIACFLRDHDGLIAPGECQADTPHMLQFALQRDGADHLVCREGEPQCPATQYFGRWEDQYVCRDAAEDVPAAGGTAIESALLCPKPHFFNSGAHRAGLIVTHDGERYAMAFEEAWPPLAENLFIAPFSAEGWERLAEPGTGERIFSSAIEAATGQKLDPASHRFVVEILAYAAMILDAGCEPSDSMYSY